MNLPTVGNRVEYLTHTGDGGDVEKWTPIGKVMGFGTSNGQPVAIVNLHVAQYTADRAFFITNLVVHLDSLRVEGSA